MPQASWTQLSAVHVSGRGNCCCVVQLSSTACIYPYVWRALIFSCGLSLKGELALKLAILSVV